jgi:AcrR family transcriptional regulator
VTPDPPPPAGRLRSSPYSEAQDRTIAVALDLFVEHGVSGTSLQMIADALGVTKAAVYHQFNTKEEIVVAAIEFELLGLEAALDAAQAAERGPRALDVLMGQVVHLAIEQHRMVGALQHDPVIVRLLAEHRPFQEFMQRLYGALLGGDHRPEARVRAAMISGALGGAVTHPLVADLDKDVLAEELIRQTRRFLELPG